MARRVSWSRVNSRRPLHRPARVVVTALSERDDSLLLVQLAKGPLAGFWLLPSATVEEGSCIGTLRRMLPERTGHPVATERLLSVIEEPKLDVHLLRFAFAVTVGEKEQAPSDPEIARARWFQRAQVRDLLAEREVVPNLGVMSLVRAWAYENELQPLEVLLEDTLCPCGSSYRYPGCCGWDTK